MVHDIQVHGLTFDPVRPGRLYKLRPYLFPLDIPDGNFQFGTHDDILLMPLKCLKAGIGSILPDFFRKIQAVGYNTFACTEKEYVRLWNNERRRIGEPQS